MSLTVHIQNSLPDRSIKLVVDENPMLIAPFEGARSHDLSALVKEFGFALHDPLFDFIPPARSTVRIEQFDSVGVCGGG